MNTKLMIAFTAVLAVFAAATLLLNGQEIRGTITQGEKPTIAVPDLRGTGDAQRVMDTFNQTLWSELEGSGVLKMAGKSFYPLEVPQQPQDFRPPTTAAPLKRGD